MAEGGEGESVFVRIRATVPSGLEITAAEECVSVLGTRPSTSRGCIQFPISSLDQLHKVDSLRSVDNFNVVVMEIKNFCNNKSSVLERLELLPISSIDNWLNPLRAWRYYTDNVIQTKKPHPSPDNKSPTDTCSSNQKEEQSTVAPPTHDYTTPDSLQQLPPDPSNPLPDPVHPLPDSLSNIDCDTNSNCDTEASETSTTNSKPVTENVPDPLPNDVDIPPSQDPELTSVVASEFKGHSFRVTAARSGPRTVYTSSDAAKYLGSWVISAFNWTVDLRNSDIEVLLNLSEEDIVVSVALTRKSKYIRNLTYFGPTSLRATIAHGLLRLAHPKPGEIILDPMCGGGSITIEGFYSFPGTYHIGGDIHTLACNRIRDNVAAITNEMGVAAGKPVGVPIDLLQWDISQLPLRTASVDIVVTDMPFGKRMGSRANNWTLYRCSLEECGRVCVPETGRGIFMTHDTKALSAAIKTLSSLWQRYRTYWINLGGLKTGVHVLLRTKTRV